MNHIVILDFYNILHRSYHAFPRDLKTSKGVQTNAVYGFISSVLSVTKELNPTHLVVASESDRSFRAEEYKEYKANRTWRAEHPDEAKELDDQAKLVNSILKTMGIPVILLAGYEADDVMGTLAKKYSQEGNLVTLVTSDQDALQLVSPLIKVYRPSRPPYLKKKIYDEREVIKDFGFGSERVVEYKSLRGDPSDNIPGVKGVGEINAKKLIKEFSTLENLYEHINLINPPALKNKLENGKDSAFLSKRLATIVTNVPLDFSLKGARVRRFDTKEVENTFKEYEFNSLLKKIFVEDKKNTFDDNKNQLFLDL